MIITALIQKGNNVLVCFEDGELITLDYRTVTDNGLRKNDPVDEKKYEELIFESNFLKAKDSAFRFLSRRHHSVSELRIKLIKKKYSKEIIEKVIKDLLIKNYLDDEQFSEEYTQERFIKKKIGTGKLKAELYKKGIDRKIIDKVISSVDANVAYDNVLKLATKKLKSLKERNVDLRKVKPKLFSYLHARGYDIDLIKKVMNELSILNDED